MTARQNQPNVDVAAVRWTTNEMARALGITPQALNKLRRRDLIASEPDAEGTWNVKQTVAAYVAFLVTGQALRANR